MNYKKSAKYLLDGVIVFFSLMSICILIRPAGLVVNSGISYYGNYIETLFPYAVAFLANSFLLWKASTIIGDKRKIDTYLGYALKIVAILMIGIMLTPYNAFNMTNLNLVHRTFGTAMFSVQMIMAVTIATYAYRDWVNDLFLATAFLSGFAALIYMLQPTGFMIEAQIVFQISIWSIFIRYLNHVSNRTKKKIYNK